MAGSVISIITEGRKLVSVLPQIAGCVLFIEIKGIRVMAEQQAQWQKGEQIS